MDSCGDSNCLCHLYRTAGSGCCVLCGVKEAPPAANPPSAALPAVGAVLQLKASRRVFEVIDAAGAGGAAVIRFRDNGEKLACAGPDILQNSEVVKTGS